MTIREVCELYDITPYTLRYYERVGVIPAVHRNGSGIRNYTDEDIGWVQTAVCFRNAGLPIEKLIEYVRLFRMGDETIPARCLLLKEAREEMLNARSKFDEALAKLDYKISRYEEAERTGILTWDADENAQGAGERNMGKRVVVISTSLRPGSNSEAMARAFANGAAGAGNEVELISLRGKKIAFCTGCMACQKTGRCIIKDDAIAIAESVLRADVVAWATPIYYYEMSGQMKTLIDRMNSLYPSDYSFRHVYLLSTAAEDGADVPERAVAGLKGWIDCYEKAELKGTIFCGGVSDAGDISGSGKLNDAYEMGRGV